MKKISLLTVLIVVLTSVLYTRCTKANTDQPCGIYGDNQQLFKDSDNKCYYKDNSGKKVYLDQSFCNCY